MEKRRDAVISVLIEAAKKTSVICINDKIVDNRSFNKMFITLLTNFA